MTDSNVKIPAFVFLSAVFCYSAATQMAEHHFKFDGSHFFTSMEDVMITLRVAYNFANGECLCFNKNEFVAANTSLFWPIVLSPLFLLFSNLRVIEISNYLSVLFVLLTLFATIRYSRGAAASILAGIFFSTSTSVHFYLTTAWETIPQMLFVTLGLLVLSQRVLPSANDIHRTGISLIFFSVAFLLRPDSGVFFIIPGTALIFYSLRNRKILIGALYASIPAITVIFYFALHYALYADFVPNTYYMKVTGGAGPILLGLAYTIRNLFLGGNIAFFLGIILLFTLRMKLFSAYDTFALLCCVLFGLYVINVGGDFFPNGRFFLVITPYLIVLFSEMIFEFIDDKESDLSRPTVAAFVCAVFIFLPVLIGSNTLHSNSNATLLRAPGGPALLGKENAHVVTTVIVKRHLRPEDGSIGMFYIGNLPYYLEDFHVTDFLGKADPHIARLSIKPGAPHAHNKWDIDYSLRDSRVAAIYVNRPFKSDDEAKVSLNRRKGEYFHADLWLNDTFKDKYVRIPWELLGVPLTGMLAVRQDLVNRFCELLDDSYARHCRG